MNIVGFDIQCMHIGLKYVPYYITFLFAQIRRSGDSKMEPLNRSAKLVSGLLQRLTLTRW